MFRSQRARMKWIDRKQDFMEDWTGNGIVFLLFTIGTIIYHLI